MTTITIPDFNFSAFYYAQILESLIQYKRLNVPELTDESAQEPFIQFLRAVALVGHLNNVHVDMVANESTLPTARLESTVRNMLRLIDYELSPAAPSQVDILGELSQILTAATEIIPAISLMATKRQEDQPVINFEALDSFTVDPTNELSYCLAEEAGSFVDYTSECNNQVIGNDFNPWSTPDIKDSIYFGHKHIMPEKLNIVIKTAGDNVLGKWEYYDGNYSKTSPTSITDLGSYLKVDLTNYIGTVNNEGKQVRVAFNQTGAYEDLEVQFGGGINFIETTGYLGQTSPSLIATDYTVGGQWEEFSNIADGTNGLENTGDITYVLPQTVTENWITGTIDGKTAYWIRYRLYTVFTPVSPDIDYAKIDTGKQYIIVQATQGRTITQDPLGSSDGSADQRFETSKDYYISGSMQIWVDSVLWTLVDDFLSSESTDRHYRIELGDDDRATVVFSDGISGKIPDAGLNNIVATYRYGANENGNVGAETITVDKQGLSYINSIVNPRPAAGWAQAEGSTTESLETAKIAGPASLRIKDVAIGPDDVELLTTEYTDDDGASPFSRAKAIEEGYGPKTIQIIVVASGGNPATSTQLDDLETYFNGDDTVYPPLEKHLVMNQEATAVNYTQKVIDITATITGDVEEETITNQLAGVIQPEALKTDGVTYEWEFGGNVPVSRLIHEIFKSDQDITDVDITVPASDVVLGATELPVLGTLSLTII
jgi:hypothetical protein